MRNYRLMVYSLILIFLAIFMAEQVLAVTNNPADIQPGWLVKNLKYVEVFYVDANKVLRWIVNEATAEKQFGVNWNKIIKEYEDLSSAGLKFGDAINFTDPLINPPANPLTPVTYVIDGPTYNFYNEICTNLKNPIEFSQCKDSDKLFNATYKKNLTRCKAYPTQDEKDLCHYYYAIYTDKKPAQCSLVANKKTKEECYLESADSLYVCNTYVSATYNKSNKEICYVNVGIRKNDASICGLIKDSYLQADCYAGIAYLTSNDNLCDKAADKSWCAQILTGIKFNISQDKGQKERKVTCEPGDTAIDCLKKTAIKNKDLNFCQGTDYKKYYSDIWDQSHSGFDESGNPLDPNDPNSKNIYLQTAIENCYMDFVDYNQDLSICENKNYVKTASGKWGCYFFGLLWQIPNNHLYSDSLSHWLFQQFQSS